MSEGPIIIDEWAPEDIVRDLNQCNRTCRQMPKMARRGGDWMAYCLCSCAKDADMLRALLQWNNANPVKRLTSAAKLAALREINRKAREKALGQT